MKLFCSPKFWVLIGISCFYPLCYSTELIVQFIVSKLQLWDYQPYTPRAVFELVRMANIGGGIAMSFASGLCIKLWNEKRNIQSRSIALGTGIIILSALGIAWCQGVIRAVELDRRAAELAYLTPILLWAICLIIFALFARTET